MFIKPLTYIPLWLNTSKEYQILSCVSISECIREKKNAQNINSLKINLNDFEQYSILLKTNTQLTRHGCQLSVNILDKLDKN